MKISSLFALFVTVIVVVIGAEVLVNDYGVNPQDGASNTLENGSSESGSETHDWSQDFDTLKKSEDGKKTNEGTLDPLAISFDAADNFGDSVAQPTPQVEVGAHVTFGLIGLSGFKGVTLQRVPFNGILFERIDLREFKTVPVVSQNLLQNNKDTIANFYEFHGDNELLAGEIYLLIREKAAAGLDVNVNEVNDFGDKSFYINYGDQPHRVFLVVKIKESVYALTYEKGLHSFMTALLKYLNT